jgi:hypothetical protein
MGKMKEFNPFKNESDCIQIGELTIENRVDRVSIFGSIDITLDKAGLAVANELKSIIDSTLANMEKIELPDKITIAPAESVNNPFA